MIISIDDKKYATDADSRSSIVKSIVEVVCNMGDEMETFIIYEQIAKIKMK